GDGDAALLVGRATQREQRAQLLPQPHGIVAEPGAQFLLARAAAEIEPDVLGRQRDQRIGIARFDGGTQTGAKFRSALYRRASILRSPGPFCKRAWRGCGIDDLLGRLGDFLDRRFLLAAGRAANQQGDREEPFHPALRASSSSEVSTRRGLGSSAAP